MKAVKNGPWHGSEFPNNSGEIRGVDDSYSYSVDVGPFLVDGHGAVVGEVSVVHHGVHVVTPDSEEGGPHTPGHRRHLHGSA